MNTTDRLADVLQEVVESAVRKEEEAASERLVRDVKHQMGQTQLEASENLRREITEQAAVLEGQLLQECRARTEQLLSATLETALRGLSEQMDEMAAKTEERVRRVFDGLAGQLEQRTAKALAETTSRIEEQVEKATKDIHDKIAQNVLMELTEKQKVLVGQVQQQIGMVTEQNLIRLRGGLTRTLQELAEASQNGGFVA
jgi:Cdc6-like AAA superfamily ATPase